MSVNNDDNGKLIDFSKTSDLLKIDEDMLTLEHWKEAKEDLGLFADGYASGQQSMVKMVNHLLELELPFEELKKQLTGFLKERTAFTQNANVP